ncbi:uncharacterized protein F4822DRAFT_434872 [Hypoxylon trugodes]|uniref:uncharacterized protein n=1 Tax=Hypoxylon trugodes TaxID=326681 RepID=UPI002197B103|nr:uncharacterized protein F4822DRAFT_434872 [Hypoxylon trugodes]KAI1382943.1 hypothetical protein F4822DRAFT_434872 [Hypoxylon trugodes]
MRVKERQYKLLEEKKIDHEGLRSLFDEDQLVVFRELRDEWVVARVRFFRGLTLSRESSTETVNLECEAIEFDGKSFRCRVHQPRVAKFTGTKNITELEVYPLSYHSDRLELIRGSIESGRWRQLCNQLVTQDGTRRPAATVMQYVGYCEMSGMRVERRGIEEGRNEIDTGREISGRVIVDPTKFPARKILFTKHNVDPFAPTGKPEGDPLENDPLLLCPTKVLVYSLSDNAWYYVAMRKLENPTWVDNAWKRLVKPGSKFADKSIERIRLLAKAHADIDRSRQMDGSFDNFRGKGKGLTFLLHGPPGVGKTMLAECLRGAREAAIQT